ncbi:hypothetical protein [Amycolatopsis anabasis]|uniref:hypothetical protein n=1 Tax=Amycolatopsis anabasis TaxID=1840409 RepID=UPI00131BAD20|nr:hypothetical protein [Amycolatopsis anabasis]
MIDVPVDRSTRRMRVILGVDAVWEVVLAAAHLAIPWGPLGLPPARPWWLFVTIGVGSLAFALVLAAAARGRDTVAVCVAAAIGNALTALAFLIVLVFLPNLHFAWFVGVAVTAVCCAAFAALEWQALS